MFAKVSSQICQILNSQSRKGQTLLKIMPKWQNFAKSGHTGCALVLQSNRGNRGPTSKPSIGKERFYTFNYLEKTKIMKKRSWESPILGVHFKGFLNEGSN